MKRLIPIIIIAFLLGMGCATVKVNPETGDIKYTRVGDQQIQGFKLTKTAEGDMEVSFKGQTSDATALAEAVKVIGVLATP